MSHNSYSLLIGVYSQSVQPGDDCCPRRFVLYPASSPLTPKERDFLDNRTSDVLATTASGWSAIGCRVSVLGLLLGRAAVHIHVR